MLFVDSVKWYIDAANHWFDINYSPDFSPDQRVIRTGSHTYFFYNSVSVFYRNIHVTFYSNQTAKRQ